MSAPLGVTDANGGNGQPALSQSVVASILVQPLVQASQFLSSGVQIFDSPGGRPLRLPKQAAPVDPQWVGENQLIPDVSPEFTEIDLLPTTLPSVKTLVRFSSELARQSVINLDAALQSRLVTDVAAVIDQGLITGNGDGITGVRGMLNFPGVQTIDCASSAMTLDQVLTAWGMAAGAFVNTANLRLMMRHETFVRLRQVKAGSALNSYALGTEDVSKAVGPSIHGIPVQVCDRIPVTGSSTKVTKAVLWDPSQTAVARDLAPSVKVLDQTFADHDQLALRVVTRYDTAPMNAAAIVRFDNVLL